MPQLPSATEEQKLKLSAHMVKLVAAEYVTFWTSKGRLYSLSDCSPDVTGIGSNIRDPEARRQGLVEHYRANDLNYAS